MSNPWDLPDIPNQGDFDESKTYEGVGRVMSGWEMIELEISFIHNAFVGDLTFGAAQDYGKGRIFRERLAIVQASAASLFRVRPCQTVEGNFQHLILQVEGFSNRRNDIAHGIVFQIDNITFFSEKLLANARGKRQSACIPPYYALRKHADGFPSYAYTYQLLMDLQRKLQLLNIKLRYFRSSLAGYCDGWHPGGNCSPLRAR